MTARRPRSAARRAASPVERNHLTTLHLDVYGYLTADEADRIAAMSTLRVAQEIAGLQRAKAEKDALDRARAELRQLHRSVFGETGAKVAEKLADIDTYDAVRVRAELVTLRRMKQTQSARWLASVKERLS